MADKKSKQQQIQSMVDESNRPMPTMQELYSTVLNRMRGEQGPIAPPNKREQRLNDQEKFIVPDVRESQADYKRAMDKLDELDKRRIIDEFRRKQQDKPVMPQMSDEQLKELQSEFEAPDQVKQNVLRKLLNK